MSEAGVLVALALAAANLPFFADRLLIAIPLRRGKHPGWHLLELALLYCAVGAVATLLERRMGPPHAQHWEFYAATACLFLVFAFPGFAYRYLWRKRR